MVVGGKTPLIGYEELASLGYSAVLYANVALQASISAMQLVLGHLIRQGSVDGIGSSIASFEERQRLVGKHHYDDLQLKYKA